MDSLDSDLVAEDSPDAQNMSGSPGYEYSETVSRSPIPGPSHTPRSFTSEEWVRVASMPRASTAAAQNTVNIVPRSKSNTGSPFHPLEAHSLVLQGYITLWMQIMDGDNLYVVPSVR